MSNKKITEFNKYGNIIANLYRVDLVWKYQLVISDYPTLLGFWVRQNLLVFDNFIIFSSDGFILI